MQPQHLKERQIHRIAPGEFFATNGAVVISTLLGSCVAACLYDPEAKVLGMNHFLLSTQRQQSDVPIGLTEAGRYGIHSMELLINSMMRKGALRHRIRAKAFGGASIFSAPDEARSYCSVGDVNSYFIKEFLENEGIPLVAADLGGQQGRVIYFDCEGYKVYVRKIAKWRSGVLAKRDNKWLETSRETQKKVDTTVSTVDLFL